MTKTSVDWFVGLILTVENRSYLFIYLFIYLFFIFDHRVERQKSYETFMHYAGRKIGKSKIDTDFQFLLWIKNEWTNNPRTLPPRLLVSSIPFICIVMADGPFFLQE